MSAAGGRDPARRALEAELLAWMRGGDWDAEPAGAGDPRFEPLALALFRFQFERCAPYRRFCAGRGVAPDRVVSWREIPAVPTGAFKELALQSFPPGDGVRVFRSSGTSTARRGALHLDTLELYEASLLATFRRYLLPELGPGERARLRILAPAPEEAPDSSLSYMFGTAVAELGDAESGFDVQGGELRLGPLWAALERAAEQGVPVALCGTAFAWVHLLDAAAAEGRRFALPEGSRAMETGGFKGRSRTVSRDALYGELAGTLGIPPQRIVNQYGMTELGSQFYDGVLRHPGRSRAKYGPPWARAWLVGAEPGREVEVGEVGAIRILDLANLPSICAIQTTDLGRRLAAGFEVLGRAAGAEARGCSVAADAMLGP